MKIWPNKGMNLWFFFHFPFTHKVYDMTIKSDIRDCNVLFIQGFQLYSVLLAICIMFDLILWWQKKLKTNTEKKTGILCGSIGLSQFKIDTFWINIVFWPCVETWPLLKHDRNEKYFCHSDSGSSIRGSRLTTVLKIIKRFKNWEQQFII